MQINNPLPQNALLLLGNLNTMGLNNPNVTQTVNRLSQDLKARCIELSVAQTSPNANCLLEFNTSLPLDLNGSTPRFENIVCINVFETNETLRLLNVLSALLSGQGKLHFLNPFASEHDLQDDSTTPSLDALKNLASLLGFELLKEALIKGEASFINTDPVDDPINVACLDLITGAGLSNPHTLSVKHLAFAPKRTPEFALDYIQINTLESFEVLFEKSFQHRLSKELWSYKYANASGFSMGLFKTNDVSQESGSCTLIAHYGGIKREVLFFGKPQLALQIGDVMVEHTEIKSLSRQGPFFKIATTFLNQHMGYSRQALLGFGFPNAKAMKVASMLGIYAEVDQFLEISWPSSCKAPLLLRSLELTAINWHQHEKKVDQLWALMSNDLSQAIVGIRNSHYLFRRFFQRPGKQYHLHFIVHRLTQAAIGVLVFSTVGSKTELIDLVCPLSNVSKCISMAKYLAHTFSTATLQFRITKTFAKIFQIQDSSLLELDIRIPANNWSNGPKPESLKNAWWLTSGDMDFV